MKYAKIMIPRGNDQTRLVKRVFAQIARHYDLGNRLMTLGQDRRWRRLTATLAGRSVLGGNRPANVFLDVATGTGDLAIDLARCHPRARVVGLDFSAEMLAVGRRKLKGRFDLGRVSLVRGDAFSLPFLSNTFAGAAIAFGIRNLPDRPAGLREMTRVVRPGGRVVVLETGWPEGPIFSRLYKLHFTTIIPLMAGLLTGDRESYDYLVKSTIDFPPKREFVVMMAEAGLENVGYIPFSHGAVALYIGAKPGE